MLADQKIKKLDSGYYRIKGCDIQELAGNAEIFLHSSTVQRMYDSSTVQEMWGSSTVQKMFGNSTVQRMYDGSIVQEMYDNSTVQKMCGESIAIDFKNYPKIKIIVQDPNEFKLVKIGTENNQEVEP